MSIYCNFYAAILLACFSVSVSGPAPIGRNIRSIIDDMLPRSVVPSIYRPKRAIIFSSGRVKRSPMTKEVQDPNNCIHKCWDADDERTEQVQTSFESKTHSTDRIGEDAGAQRTQMNAALDNLGSFMSDACQSAKKTKQCFQSCPPSQLKDVAIADYYVEDVSCEPEKNFGGYNNYRMSLFCINSTMAVSREYCSSHCHGEVKSLRELTQLGIDRNESDSSNIVVEANGSQNMARVKDQCKIITCTRDCSKSYLMKRCGQKGYDLYSRQLAIEPRSTLTILQKVNAISSVPPECSSLK